MDKIKVIASFKDLDVALPSIVYKYRDWNIDNHRRVLTKQELFLASPMQFEDPMDCNLDEQFPTTKEALYNLYMDDCCRKHPEWSRQRRRMFARDCCNHSPLSNEKLRNEILRETKECHDKMFGVLSLTLRDNNDYMWEHYGGQHQGFCVGYNTAKLTESGYFGSGGFVNYSDKLPYIDFVNDDTATKFVKNTFYKKTVPYSQEEEYRLAKRWDHEVTDTERVATIPIDCVVQIVIGRNAPDHIREAIREIKQKMYPNAKFLEL